MLSAENFFCRRYKEKVYPETFFGIDLPYFFQKIKTARAFFAEIYRSGNAAGDYCKATLWHTQKSA